MDQRHTSFKMYMDDITTPGISDNTNPAQQRIHVDGFIQTNSLGNVDCNLDPASGRVLYETRSTGPRFTAPVSQETCRRDINPGELHLPSGLHTSSSTCPAVGNDMRNTENYISNIGTRFTAPVGGHLMFGNDYRPVESTNILAGFPIPMDRGGSRTVTVADRREGKTENIHSGSLTELQRKQSSASLLNQAAPDRTSNLVENKAVCLTPSEGSAEHAKPFYINIEETDPCRTDVEGNKVDSVPVSANNKGKRRCGCIEDDSKMTITVPDSNYNKEMNKTLKVIINLGKDPEPVLTEKGKMPVKQMKISLNENKTIDHGPSNNMEGKQKSDHQALGSSEEKNKPSHICENCSKCFKRKDHLLRHMQTAHSDLRPFVCRVCCLAFSRKDRLTRHERVHSGAPQFSCMICDKKFFRKDSLGKHLLSGSGCKKRDNNFFCKCKHSEETNSVKTGEI